MYIDRIKEFIYECNFTERNVTTHVAIYITGLVLYAILSDWKRQGEGKRKRKLVIFIFIYK